jgi:hypothetical protein
VAYLARSRGAAEAPAGDDRAVADGAAAGDTNTRQRAVPTYTHGASRTSAESGSGLRCVRVSDVGDVGDDAAASRAADESATEAQALAAAQEQVELLKADIANTAPSRVWLEPETPSIQCGALLAGVIPDGRGPSHIGPELRANFCFALHTPVRSGV